MQLQVDQEFQQVKIMDLNDLSNVEMFFFFEVEKRLLLNKK